MKDPIPNVRFTVARIIRDTHKFIDQSTLNSSISSGLKELAQDSDRDVQYFATVALQ